jgi:GrpB-like predicted nucleotidyltransferase (UPF0157 family)
MTYNLNELSTGELGQLFPIIISDYNSDWAKIFLLEKQNILSITEPGIILRIEHIGSTAVPGLCAKPTIDILIEISDNTDCNLLIDNLQKIQYQYIPRPDNPPPHIMLAKGYSIKGFTGQAFHIHIRYSGDWDEIVFRNYLINNPDVAHEYGELKRKLSIEYRNDREKYTDSKGDFISGITKTARRINKQNIS